MSRLTSPFSDDSETLSTKHYSPFSSPARRSQTEFTTPDRASRRSVSSSSTIDIECSRPAPLLRANTEPAEPPESPEPPIFTFPSTRIQFTPPIPGTPLPLFGPPSLTPDIVKAIHSLFQNDGPYKVHIDNVNTLKDSQNVEEMIRRLGWNDLCAIRKPLSTDNLRIWWDADDKSMVVKRPSGPHERPVGSIITSLTLQQPELFRSKYLQQGLAETIVCKDGSGRDPDFSVFSNGSDFPHEAVYANEMAISETELHAIYKIVRLLGIKWTILNYSLISATFDQAYQLITLRMSNWHVEDFVDINLIPQEFYKPETVIKGVWFDEFDERDGPYIWIPADGGDAKKISANASHTLYERRVPKFNDNTNLVYYASDFCVPPNVYPDGDSKPFFVIEGAKVVGDVVKALRNLRDRKVGKVNVSGGTRTREQNQRFQLGRNRSRPYPSLRPSLHQHPPLPTNKQAVQADPPLT